MVPADPVITEAPLLPRQNDAQFIGYVSVSGTYYSETCNLGLTWYQDTKYAQCCPVSLASCYAPTACVGGSLIYPYPDKSTTRTIACTDNYDNKAYSICNTAFIFENLSDSSPKTDIVCGASSVNWSYYRKIPASATGAAASANQSLVDMHQRPQYHKSLQLPLSVLRYSKPKSKPSPVHSSHAWIAGAIIGPLVGLAIIGAAIFFLLRHRKNKKTIAPQAGGAAMAHTDPSQPPAGVGGYTDAKPQFPPQQDPYANQGAYNAQQGYNGAAVSPAPQYATPVPYNAPGSPPPQQAYQSDVKYGYAGAPANGAAELGGVTGAAPVGHQTVPSPLPSPGHQAAEMAGDSTHHNGGHYPSAELASTTGNPQHPM